MAAIFHPATNAAAKVSVLGAGVILAGIIWVILLVVRSSWATGVDEVVYQPVPFDHDHHVWQVGIDCRYCHLHAETSSFAGIPSTQTCMNCHAEIWRFAPMLEPVRQSLRDGEPLVWNRVHQLPDFAYFDHSVHLHAGIGCMECHGRVDRMPLVSQQHSLHMQWCLDCHRDPEQYVRPREEVYNMQWPPAEWPGEGTGRDQPSDPSRGLAPHWSERAGSLRELREQLVEEYHIIRKESCSDCHR